MSPYGLHVFFLNVLSQRQLDSQTKEEMETTFGRFGKVLEIYLAPEPDSVEPYLRAITRVTMEREEDALRMVQLLAGATIPYDSAPTESNDENTVGANPSSSSSNRSTVQYFKIGVEVARKQLYRERAQRRLELQHALRKRDWLATPEMVRMERLAQRALEGLIPNEDHILEFRDD